MVLGSHTYLAYFEAGISTSVCHRTMLVNAAGAAQLAKALDRTTVFRSVRRTSRSWDGEPCHVLIQDSALISIRAVAAARAVQLPSFAELNEMRE